MLWLSIEVNLIYVLYTTFRAPTEVTLLDHQCVFGCGSESLVCKIPLLARALGLKAKRATIGFVYKIPYRRARAWPSGCASKGILHTTIGYLVYN